MKRKGALGKGGIPRPWWEGSHKVEGARGRGERAEVAERKEERKGKEELMKGKVWKDHFLSLLSAGLLIKFLAGGKYGHSFQLSPCWKIYIQDFK
jgi:hypothetical protein